MGDCARPPRRSAGRFAAASELLSVCLEAGHCFEAFWIASALHGDLGCGGVDFAQILGRELDRQGADIFVEAIELCGAGDRGEPRLLREQPRERDLGGSRVLALRDRAEQVDEGLVGLERVGREARERAAKIGGVELRIFVDLAGEEAFAERAIRHETDSEFFERGDHFLLGLAPPEGVFALQRCERLDGVGAANRFHAGLGKSEVLDLAGLDEFLDGAGHVFDGHVGIDAMLIEKVDGVDLEALERAFDGLLDVGGLAIQARGAWAMIGTAEIETELGGDHDFVAIGSERFADELFVEERAVDFGGVEEGDAAVEGGVEEGGHLFFVFGRAVGKAHAHTAESDGGNFQIAFAEFARLHYFSPGAFCLTPD